MNFTVTWIMDKLGFTPKASVDFQEWPFPVVKKATTVAKKATTATKKVAKKTVKIPKATTRKITKK